LFREMDGNPSPAARKIEYSMPLGHQGKNPVHQSHLGAVFPFLAHLIAPRRRFVVFNSAAISDRLLSHGATVGIPQTRSNGVFRILRRPAVESDGIRKLLHLVLLFLDALDEFKLGAAPVEVVMRPMHPEISVAAQVICQEPDANREGD
jgi:hypothetical protein